MLVASSINFDKKKNNKNAYQHFYPNFKSGRLELVASILP